MPVDRPAHVLAMTDGFSTIIDLYARYTGASIIAAALERGLTSIVDEIRTVETSDRTGLEFPRRSEEHTSELQSLMRISFDVFCLKKKNTKKLIKLTTNSH